MSKEPKEIIQENNAETNPDRQAASDAGAAYGTTRVVERQRRPYAGFITEEQIAESREAVRIDDRYSQKVIRDDRQEIFKTRVYSGLEEALKESGRDVILSRDSVDQDSENRPEHKYSRVRITDSRKFRRLIAVAVAALVLLAADIGLGALKARAAAYPAQTKALTEQTEELRKKSAEAEKEAADYGNYEEKKELKESWERLRDRLKTEEASE